MAAALESLWFKRERAAGLLLSLRRAVGWKLLHNFFPCLPRSPVARFPSGLLERAVRIYEERDVVKYCRITGVMRVL